MFPSFFLVIASSTLISREIFEVIVNAKRAYLVDAETDYKKSHPVLGRPATLICKSVLLNLQLVCRTTTLLAGWTTCRLNP